MTSTDNETKPFRWTKGLIAAAPLLAEDEMSDARIAEEVGISTATLARAKRHPEFQKRIAEHEADLDREARRGTILRLRGRLKKYADMDRRLQIIVDEREAEMVAVTGGKSGYLVRQKKSVGYGRETQIVEEVAFDSALHREQRALMEQAARETGQWVEKGEISGPNGGAIKIREVVIDRTAKPSSDDDDDPEDNLGDD